MRTVGARLVWFRKDKSKDKFSASIWKDDLDETYKMENIRQNKRKIQKKNEGEEQTGEGGLFQQWWPFHVKGPLPSLSHQVHCWYTKNHPYLKSLLHKPTLAHYL